jgi:ADP-heptose:LPS heptosyltransferase
MRLLLSLGRPRSPGATPRFRAVIYKPERLGDFFLAGKAIRALVDYWGESQSALVVSDECLTMAEQEFPGLARVVVPLRLGAGGWHVGEALRLRRELAGYSCENLICLRHHRQPLASAALRWIPARTRWALVGHPWMPAATQAAERGLFEGSGRYPWPSRRGMPTEVQAHADLLRIATGTGIDAEDLLPTIPAGAARHPPNLVVVPWGSGEINTLPDGLIAEILSLLRARAQFVVRIVAEEKRRPQEEALLRELRARLPGLDVAHERTPALADLRSCLARASAVLTADTLPAHLATAADRPVAVVATGAWPGLFGPWSRTGRQRWFIREMPCWGCGWRCIHPRPLCLWDVEPEAVADFLSPFLRP